MSELKSRADRSPAKQERRRSFSEDFKRDAVRLVVEEKYTFAAAAKAVGVSAKSLREWHQRFAPPPEACGENATVEELREENRRLRRQLKRAELEREILKKRRRILPRSRCKVRLDHPARRLVSRPRHVRRPAGFALGLLRFDRPAAQVHAESYGIYGSVKVAEVLQAGGSGVGLSQHGRHGDAGGRPEEPCVQAVCVHHDPGRPDQRAGGQQARSRLHGRRAESQVGDRYHLLGHRGRLGLPGRRRRSVQPESRGLGDQHLVGHRVGRRGVARCNRAAAVPMVGSCCIIRIVAASTPVTPLSKP